MVCQINEMSSNLIFLEIFEMMFLQPRSIKFKKQFHKSNFLLKQEVSLNQGCFCLIATTNLCISAPQLRSFIIQLRRAAKKQVKIWNLAQPQVSITKKPNESRLGKGYGSFSYWLFALRANQPFLEIKFPTIAKVSVETIEKIASKNFSTKIDVLCR